MATAKDIFGKIKRQTDFISMVALNRTAAEMALFRYPNLVQEVFDRPTPYIMKGFKYRKATKEDMRATVYADDFVGPSVHKSLSAQVFGGLRKPKRFELALRAKGILPADQFAVPGSDASIDSYGNQRGSQLVQILSGLQAFSQTGYIANRSTRAGARTNRNTGNYFVVNTLGRKSSIFMEEQSSISNAVKGLPMGIYQRVGKYKIKQVIKFIRQPVYQKRFNFFDDGQRIGMQIFNNEFKKAFDQYAKG
jgi:hypothetical protein